MTGHDQLLVMHIW